MKAAVVHSFDKPLQVEEVPTPKPNHGQVLVKMETCGLCHTDIHAAHRGRQGSHLLARIRLRGLRVLRIRTRNPLPQPAGLWVLGRRRLCRVRVGRSGVCGTGPEGLDPLDAAPLTCAGVTTYKAVKVAGTRSSDLVAVYGIGGLGHLAV